MKALITGITGQDGPYLADYLLRKGYEVVGTCRRSGHYSLGNLEYLGIEKDVKIVTMELTEYENVMSVLYNEMPDEIYHLAAQSHVGESFNIPIYTTQVIVLGTLHLLEAIRSVYTGSGPKFYNASTSELFGGVEPEGTVFDEDTPFKPRSPYACAKLAALSLVCNYRDAYRLFACNGILFNHESPLRGDNFVTKKVVHGIYEWYVGGTGVLHLGNLNAKRDWGHAADYVRAMHMMLQHHEPNDYVVATGESTSIRDFVDIVCEQLELDDGEWIGEGADEKLIINDEVVVDVSPEFYRPTDCVALCGNSSRIHDTLGWERHIGLRGLVKDMIRFEEGYYKL